MGLKTFALFLLLWCQAHCNIGRSDKLPLVINTWPFVDANKGGKYLDICGGRG